MCIVQTGYVNKNIHIDDFHRFNILHIVPLGSDNNATEYVILIEVRLIICIVVKEVVVKCQPMFSESHHMFYPAVVK